MGAGHHKSTCLCVLKGLGRGGVESKIHALFGERDLDSDKSKRGWRFTLPKGLFLTGFGILSRFLGAEHPRPQDQPKKASQKEFPAGILSFKNYKTSNVQRGERHGCFELDSHLPRRALQEETHTGAAI